MVNDQADRLTIELDIGDEDVGSDGGNFGNELGEGDTASVRITSPSGSTTEYRIVAPKTLSSDSAVSL